MAVAQTRQRGGKRREQACDTSTSVTASGKAQLRRPAPKLQSLVPRAGSVSHADQPGCPSVPEASCFCAQPVIREHKGRSAWRALFKAGCKSAWRCCG